MPSEACTKHTIGKRGPKARYRIRRSNCTCLKGCLGVRRYLSRRGKAQRGTGVRSRTVADLPIQRQAFPGTGNPLAASRRVNNGGSGAEGKGKNQPHTLLVLHCHWRSQVSNISDAQLPAPYHFPQASEAGMEALSRSVPRSPVTSAQFRKEMTTRGYETSTTIRTTASTEH